MRLINIIFGLSACLSCSLAHSQQAVLIGGGSDLQSSDIQIEQNVQWVQDTLESLGVASTVYFNDGDDPAVDVKYLVSEEDYNNPLEPITRIYGNYIADRTRYKSSSLINVKGSTQSAALSNNLDQFLSKTNEPTFLVYMGLGSPSPSTAEKSSLDLWGDTTLKADQLQKVLSTAKAPIHYLFNQCNSGGFNSMIYENPAKGAELSNQRICGFTSQTPHRPSEKCSATCGSADSAGYSSHFFAALSGYDRHGEILPRETDTDKDGSTSLREAHFYSIEESFSTDIAFSSSEYFLGRWQPWYLKWLPAPQSLPNNEYAKLFRSLSGKYEMPLQGNIAKSIHAKLDDIEKKQQSLADQHQAVLQQESQIQSNIQTAAHENWPALAQPYTQEFKNLIVSDEILNAAQWISEHKEFAKLLETRAEAEKLQEARAEGERYIAQLKKMLHLRQLAALKDQLYQYGSPEEVTNYERLLMCENESIGNAQGI